MAALGFKARVDPSISCSDVTPADHKNVQFHFTFHHQNFLEDFSFQSEYTVWQNLQVTVIKNLSCHCHYVFLCFQGALAYDTFYIIVHKSKVGATKTI